MSLRTAGTGAGTNALCHVGYTFLCDGEIGMMRKQVEKLDKNHLEIVHLDTWKYTALFTKSPESTCLNTNWVALHDMPEKQTHLPGEHEFLSKE
jgi:hypothetical protein